MDILPFFVIFDGSPFFDSRAGHTPTPRVNFVLTSENQNMTGGKTLLRAWHNGVARLKLAQVQQDL
jgi:hypothetical protein